MKKKILFFAASLTSLFVMAAFSPAYAQEVNPFEDVCRSNPNATVCKDSKSGRESNPLFGKNGVITVVFNFLSIIAGIIAVIVIIISGLKYITSGSNPQDANNAREGVLYAVVGLVIALLAQAIVQFFLKNIGGE
jgi:type IV secretory pathway VirB2 component (pilin)